MFKREGKNAYCLYFERENTIFFHHTICDEIIIIKKMFNELIQSNNKEIPFSKNNKMNTNTLILQTL